MVAYADLILRPRDLVTADQHPRANQFHVYLIGTMPRLTVVPGTDVVDDKYLNARIHMHGPNGGIEFQVSGRHELGSGIVSEVAYPYEDFSLRALREDRGLRITPTHLALMGWQGYPQASREFTVEYVGQAFGSSGSRTAVERLTQHGTLQKILANVNRDREVWIIMCRIGDALITTGILPIEGAVPWDEDVDHQWRAHKWIAEMRRPSRETVDLAEAGLIRYFAPPYNTQLRDSFPKLSHRAVTALAELDLHSVMAELQTHDLGVLVGNALIPYGNWHAATYDVSFDSNRAAFLGPYEEPSPTAKKAVIRRKGSAKGEIVGTTRSTILSALAAQRPRGGSDSS